MFRVFGFFFGHLIRDRIYGGDGGDMPPHFWTGGHNIFVSPNILW